MEINLPVWSYYPKDDKNFLDPLYAPYLNVPIKTEDGVCEVNMWKKQGYADGFLNPALVRKGWGLNFQLMYPQFDPCPSSWAKGEDGWCYATEPEFGDHGLYSKDAFIPKYQYWNSYAPRLKDPRKKMLNEFDQKSVNPWTGNYVSYSKSNPSKERAKYGSLPSKYSLLA